VIVALLIAAQGASVSRQEEAQGAVQVARYKWHECVTLAAMNEVTGGYRRGYMSLASEACQGEEDAVRRTLDNVAAIEGGDTDRQLEEWRNYEIRWAQAIVDAGGDIPKPSFKFRP
jgi:hypothetical protein